MKYNKRCRIIFISNVQHQFLIVSEACSLLPLLLNISMNQSYSNNNVKRNVETLERNALLISDRRYISMPCIDTPFL
jgi:hypothetical protein